MVFKQLKKLHWQIRKYCPVIIASVRPYLSDANTAQLVSSPILSRLDYCHSTLSGLPSCSLNRLQKVKTMRPDLSSANENQTTLLLFWKKLQWLPVEARIHYKTATLAFRHFDNSLPPYLSELLHTYQPSWTLNLRSTSEKLLKVTKTNSRSAGSISFHFQAAKIWNSLPTNVRNFPSLSSFKNNLKHIFSKNASLLVCKTPFLHSLTTEWMCVRRGGGVNRFADVLYSVKMYIPFWVKRYKDRHNHYETCHCQYEARHCCYEACHCHYKALS